MVPETARMAFVRSIDKKVIRPGIFEIERESSDQEFSAEAP